MTWTKFGAEFFDDCANHGLSDAAVRTHAEAIGWLYTVESVDLTIAKNVVRRFAGSENYADGIRDLLAVEFWCMQGAKYQVVHHADVIRQSLAAQQKKRSRDKQAQRDYRKRQGLSVVPDVSDDVSADVSGDAVRQTDKQAVTEKFPSESEPTFDPSPTSPLAAAPSIPSNIDQTGDSNVDDDLFSPARRHRA